MDKQTISPRLLRIKEAAIREMIWAGITLWYYSDPKSAWERILKDKIRIDGEHRIEDLIELLTAQDAEGEIAGQLVRVVGIFRSGVPEVDQSLIPLPTKAARRSSVAR